MAISNTGNCFQLVGSLDDGVATSSYLGQIVDSSKSWTTDQWAGRKVWIYDGDMEGYSALIISNTATAIVIEPALPDYCGVGDKFMIGYTHEDLYDYDVANSLGYITKKGNQYDINGRIEIGSGTEAGRSFLADDNVQVQASGTSWNAGLNSGQYSSRTFYEVVGFGGLSLGLIDSYVNKTTKAGVQVKVDSSVPLVFPVYNNTSTMGAFYELLDCSLVGYDYGKRMLVGPKGGSDKSKIWNTTFSMGSELITYLADAYNINLTRSNYGTSRVQGGFESIRINNTGTAIYSNPNGEVEGVFKNPILRNNNYDFYFFSGCTLDCEWINPDRDGNGIVKFANASISAKLLESYYLDLTVVKDGTPIENARLYIEDLYGNEIYNDLTPATGIVPQQKIQAGYYTSTTGNTIQPETPHRVIVEKYGYTRSEKTIEINSNIKSTEYLKVNPYTVANEATASGYSSKFTIDWTNKYLEIDADATDQELYDYSQYEASQSSNIQYDEPLIDLHTLNTGWIVVVKNGATLTSDSDYSTTPTAESGGVFISPDICLFYYSASLVKASRAYFQIKDSITASNIEGAVIGFGDATTSTRLLYNSSFTLDTIITDSDGKADGYFAFEIGSTSYTDMKQVTGDYNYDFSVVPRNLTGASIGSSTTPEVIRLVPDGEVTLSKTDAGNITGITVDVPTDTIDLSDETLSNAYDNLKYQVTADGEIYTGVPGCMYYCLYGLPLNKSVMSYTGRSSSTIYQNFNGTGAIFSAGIVELDTAGTYSSLTFGNVQINFEGAGTYDLRDSTFSSVTLDTIGDYTVTAKLPTGTSYVNNDPTNITVEASTAITVSNVNIVDGSRVQLYNVTQDTELENTLVSGGSGYVYSADFGSGEEIELNDQIRLRATYVNGTSAKGSLETTTVASGGNISFLDEQLDCDIYDALGVDGSTVTKFTADYSNEEVDVVVAADFNASELFAWWCYNLTLEDGIRYFFGGVTAQDVGNFRINTSILDAYLDNTTSTNIVQLDNRRIYRDDGKRPVKNPSTGGGGIDVVWRNTILLAETGVSGLTASESNQLSSITTVLSNQGIINTGVKKSSKGIPHSTDVA